MPIIFEVAPVDVMNEALGQLGKDFITDPDNPDDPVAVKATRYYSSILRTMLRDHKWNFADRDRELPVDAASPLREFAYQYTLPAECMRVNAVNGDTNRAHWKVRGRKIHTDESPVIISFNEWQPDPNFWDALFYQAFVTYLAVRFAPAFSTDVAKSSDLYKLYQMQNWDAKAVDGQEGSQDEMVCDDLTDAIRE